MGFTFCLSKVELLKALKEIEEAEKNGFKYCTPVFDLHSISDWLSKSEARFTDLWVKAHPKDPGKDWGRSLLYKIYTVKKGKLIQKEEK